MHGVLLFSGGGRGCVPARHKKFRGDNNPVIARSISRVKQCELKNGALRAYIVVALHCGVERVVTYAALYAYYVYEIALSKQTRASI